MDSKPPNKTRLSNGLTMSEWESESMVSKDPLRNSAASSFLPVSSSLAKINKKVEKVQLSQSSNNSFMHSPSDIPEFLDIASPQYRKSEIHKRSNLGQSLMTPTKIEELFNISEKPIEESVRNAIRSPPHLFNK